MFTLSSRCLIGAALITSTAANLATAADYPTPPCGETAFPAHAKLGEPESVQAWTVAALPAAWVPPACLQWRDKNFAVLVAMTGRFGDVANSRVLLRRLAAVSRLKAIRYWSFSRKEWRTLLDEATALNGPNRTQERADFTVGDFELDRDYFIWQKENSLASGVVLRTRFREISDSRLVFDQVNITASDILGITILKPFAFRTTYFVERESNDVWRYYSLTRFGIAAEALSAAQTASVINRSVALFRYLGGTPMTREPPAAP